VTSTPPGSSDCPSCGQPSGDGCRCVDAAGLLGFLDQFRSATGGLATPDEPLSPAPLGEPYTAEAGDPGPVWAPEDTDGPIGQYPPVATYPPGATYPPVPTWPPAPGPGGPAPGYWSPPAAAGWPPGAPPAWSPAGVRRPARRGIVTGAVAGALVAALAALVVVAPRLAPTKVPSLPSILSAAPDPSFAAVSGSPLEGYVSSDQLRQLDGGRSLPPGARMYATTWNDIAGNALVEVAVSTPRAEDAATFAAALYDFLMQGGGRAFSIPGLSGQAGGVAMGPSSGTPGRPQVAAVTARSRVSLLFLAGGPDSVKAQTTVTRLAQTVGGSIPLDGGTLGAPPQATVAPVAYVAGEELGAALIGALLGGGVIALVRRSRSPL
jgi:hypothetical protein